MDAVLLDTDVFSYFFKGDTRARAYDAEIKGRQLCLCFQTVAEVKAWALIRGWGKPRSETLKNVLSHYLILPYDEQMADSWATITAARKRLGKQIACGDAWIAAAALRHGIPLLTHNISDYSDIENLTAISR
jgi:tRNA(fMet)-specific endonuclease VapC